MKRSLGLVLVALVTACSPGSPTAPGEPPAVTLPTENPAPGDHATAFLDSGGTARHYLMHAPPSYRSGRTYPLVLVFHGNPGSADEMPAMTKMNEVADANDFLVVYPDQIFDTTTVAELLDHVGPKWNADPKRVHVAGFSRGGSLVYELAGKMPERFGSVAPVAASGGTDQPLSTPLSLLTFQGGMDRLRQAWNNTNVKWDTAAGCSGQTLTTITMENSPTHVYTSTCKDGNEHIVYSITGMGHRWPDDGSQLIWEFFARHPRQ
jgi:polyhydroxybutyrate depolymerase